MKRIKTKQVGVYYQLLSNGDRSYFITYKNHEEKKVWKKIGNYSEGIRENYCKKIRDEIVVKLRNGEEIVKKYKYISFKDILSKYYSTRVSSGKNIKKEMSVVNLHLLPYFEALNIDKIEEKDIIEFKKTKSHYSPKTLNNMLTILNAIFNYAHTNNLIKNNVARFIKKSKIDNSRERFLSTKEIKKLYDALVNSPRLLLFCKLALNTGGRLNTILNIKKKDIDFSNSFISLKDYKNNSTYSAYLNDNLKELLREKVANLKLEDKIFTCSESSLTKPLRKILNELYNESLDRKDTKNRVVIHTLRHTFASHLAINGTPIYTIQKLMNHKEISMTMRYAKLNDQVGREAVAGLNF